MGPEIEAFEEEVARYCGREFAVSVGSGTDALYFGLRALGIGRGHEVITTALSWVATANGIAMTGASPVFADIRDYFTIAPASVERLIALRTRAILAVDYAGRMCDAHSLEAIAREHGLLLVEDGSQAFGASIGNKLCGSVGDLSAISHNAMKVFAALGEAGTVLTDDAQVRDTLVSLRYNGTLNREVCVTPSLNGRMDTLQAAVLLNRLPRLRGILERRRANADFYDSQLRGVVGLPVRSHDRQDVFYTYQIRSNRRDELKAFLEERGIETKVQHASLMSQQPAYSSCRSEAHLGAQLVKEILCLPIHEKLTDAQLAEVTGAVRDFGSSVPAPTAVYRVPPQAPARRAVHEPPRWDDGLTVIDAPNLSPIIESAQVTETGRSRMCAHSTPDARIHEMIIAFARDSYVQPHRHSRKGESFHVIEGEIEVIFFEDDGRICRRVRLGPVGSGLPFFMRNDGKNFHTVIVHSSFAVVHETTSGPLDESDTDFAPWAADPRDPAAVAAYVASLAEK